MHVKGTLVIWVNYQEAKGKSRDHRKTIELVLAYPGFKGRMEALFTNKDFQGDYY